MSLPNELLPVGLLGTGDAGGYQIQRSLRFNSADSAYLSRTPASAGNRKTWTWAGWVKRSALSTFQVVYSTGSGATGQTNESLILQSDNTLRLINVTEGVSVNWDLVTNQVFRDVGAWFHLCFSANTTQATSSERIILYVNGSRITSFSTASYPSQNADLLTNSAVATSIGARAATNDNLFNGYLSDIHFIDGQALDPTSFAETDTTTGQWVPKAYTGSYGTNGFRLAFADNSNNTATTLGKDTSGNGNNWTPNNLSAGFNSNVNYSDSATLTGTYSPTGIKAIFDDNLTTGASNQSHSNPSNAFQTVTFGTPFTSVTSVRVYGYNGDTTGTTNLGYRINNVAYQAAVSPGNSGFAWQDLTGQLSSTGNIVSSVSVQWSGNATNATRNVGPLAIEINGVMLVDRGLDAGNDSLVDTPTSYGDDTGAGGEVRGNYCTLNPLKNGMSLSNGNLTATNSASAYSVALGTIGASSGRWYWEVTATTASGASIGVGDGNTNTGTYLGAANSFGYNPGGTIYGPGDTQTQSGLSTYTNGDVIGVALNLDSSEVKFYKNNSLVTTVTGLSSTTWFPAVSDGTSSGSNPTLDINFGQRPFAYTAPSGFKALCDTNLPAPVVAKPNTVMDIALYTGNGSARSITGLNFSPDLVWIKKRSASGGHPVFDTVRGATNYIQTHSTGAEGTDTDALTAFNSGGFSLGTGYTTVDVNQNGATYVAWCFDGGTSTVSNTQGSITSQVRANASAGFSIVTYTGNGTAGATVGHGLGVAPGFIIIKDRTAARTTDQWPTYHSSIGAAGGLVYLNLTTAGTVASVVWNNTNPSSTVFTLGNWGGINYSGDNFVAYCFAPVAGYSAFGSYTGNGSTDGVFVHTGFRPRWILIKSTNNTYNWQIFDTSRDTYNVAGRTLYPNLSNAEDDYTSLTPVDILSNGFKLRTTSIWNTSATTYIYCAFAESPFQYSRAR